jgi:3-deoxy-D-manno-octulosonic-acid transferase
MKSPKRPRILVIARGHLGDIVGAMPALRDLRSGYPSAHVTVVANEYVRGALENCPYVDEVIYGFSYSQRPLWQKSGLRLKLVARAIGRYDISLALRTSPGSSGVLSLISGARIRIGYHQRGLSGRLLTHDVGRELRAQSNRLTNLAVIRPLGLPASPAMPRLDWVSAVEQEAADQLLHKHGVGRGERFAVFQISAHWGCYEWRSDKWATLADHLARVHDLKVVVVGTGEDFELRKFSEVGELTSVPVSVQGLTSVPMLFHIVSRAALVVATDSALTQIGLAQRVPSVILFGIEPKIRNGPLPDEEGRMETIQYWEGEGNAPAPNPHCLFGESHCHTGNCCENSSFQRIAAVEVCDRADRVLAGVLVQT